MKSVRRGGRWLWRVGFVLQISSDDVHPVFSWPSIPAFSCSPAQFPLYGLTSYSEVSHSICHSVSQFHVTFKSPWRFSSKFAQLQRNNRVCISDINSSEYNLFVIIIMYDKLVAVATSGVKDRSEEDNNSGCSRKVNKTVNKDCILTN